MRTAKAHIKLQTWEWIPDQRADACHVVVYDPDTIRPLYYGLTNLEGYLEFDIAPGLYVIWVYGHNPMGYRPFLSDTWIPVAVLPGETKEVCAALVSLIDIPALYNAVQKWMQWEPKTFAKLIEQGADALLKECRVTAMQQRAVLLKEFGDLEKGVLLPVVESMDIRQDLLDRRRNWAGEILQVAKEHSPEADALAREVGQLTVDAMERRLEMPLKPWPRD